MISIAVMGFGVVGGGVVEVMEENAPSIARSSASPISVKYILDVREFPDSAYKHMLIKDFSIIESDPEVQIVVETIGGAGIAYEFTRRALLAGKSVVTSNKELVATRGQELIAIAKEKNVNYLFEASVGGGIPIIRPITQCLAANEISEIFGILNGTTNYILSEMTNGGGTFAEALSAAQEKGFAESDPSADIEGTDACRKICILSDLCFGRHVYVDDVKTEGISGVALADILYANKLGCTIKLIGRGLRTGDSSVTAYVAPHLVPVGSLLSNVNGVMNGIVVRGNAIGEAMFYGAGAGKRPTASAVVADVIDAAKHINARKFLDWDEAIPGWFTDSDKIESRFYVRVAATKDEVEKRFKGARIIVGAEAEDECAFSMESISRTKLNLLAQGLDIRSVFRILE